MSVSVTIITTIFATLAGYAFSRFKFPGSRQLFLFILTTQMFPYVLAVINLYVIYKKFNLLNSYHGLAIAITALSLPFSIWMLKGFFDRIPRELEETSWIDGTTRFGTLIKIDIPLIGPGIVSVAIYSFLLSCNNLLFALVLNVKNNLLTIPLDFYLFMREYTIVFGPIWLLVL